MTTAALWWAPFAVLAVFAALSGAVNGAGYCYLRALLNHLVPASRLPRALGIAATLNEVTFVLAPVVASGLSMLGLVAIALMGAIPALLTPNVTSVEIGKNSKVKASVLTPEIVLWLCCAIIDGAVVAAIEIGPVLMVIGVGCAPAMAILFTVPLCLASVTGGVWVSWRNRKSGQIAVVVQFAAMTFGISLVAGGTSLSMTIAGTMIVGLVLAPLSTYFSLARVIRVRSLMKRSTLSAPSQSVFSDATISNIAQHLVRGNGDIQVTYRAGQPVGSHDRQKPLETLALRV